jgi:hypothetical protein
MAYLITYLKHNEHHRLEWIVPTGWSTTAVRRAFYEQFPQAEILSLQPCCIAGCL